MISNTEKSFVWDDNLKQFIATNETVKNKFPSEIISETSCAIVSVADYFNERDICSFIDSFANNRKNHAANITLCALLLMWLYKYETHAVDFAVAVSGKKGRAIRNVLWKARQKLLPMPPLEYRTVLGIVCSESGLDTNTLISHFSVKKAYMRFGAIVPHS